MHPAVLRIAEAWQGTPFEGKAYLVGGAVRDELLGRKGAQDLDIVLEADAIEAARVLEQKGVAKNVPVVYARFGTAMVFVGGTTVELVTARRESYDPDSRKPHIEPASLLEDARRRDFTVNALMKDIWTGETLDLLGTGLEDLQERLLRTPLDPEATFRDDPLRMLRAVRFRWKLGFDYAEGLAQAIKDQAPRLQVISAERVRDEFEKMLGLEDADRAVQDLLDLRLLEQFAPEFLPMVGCEQGDYHHLDVWSHTLLALRNAGCGDLELSLSALFHDVGKPATKTLDERGKIRFFDHENVGAETARQVMRRMKFGNDTIDVVATLVQNHMRLNSMPRMTPSAARRIVRDLGGQLDRWLSLVKADANALKPGVKVLDIESVRAQLDQVRRATPAETLESPLGGREIMELLNIAPGPRLGRLKSLLQEDVLEGKIKVGDKATATIRLMEHFRNADETESVAEENMETNDSGE